jgi:acetate kinase
MADALLVLNAGSSSLKFTGYTVTAQGALDVLVTGKVEELYGAARFRGRCTRTNTTDEHHWTDKAPGHVGALDFVFSWLRQQGADTRLIGIGHRVVHGGTFYDAPVRIDDGVLAKLDTLIPLAPLHQPHNLLPIKDIARRWPDLPQIACFDTAFHATAPEVAQAFALPAEITDRGVRRYGFHGLSYEYIASVLPRHDPRAAQGRTIVLHLGNGASMCAMKSGQSVASTMGFTALDGLPMGTRCGNIDPGVVLYLMQELGLDAKKIEDLLYKRSGLFGVSGISSDMRELLDSKEPKARFAIDLYTYHIARETGSLAAALGGLDAVVFTAGIGENAAAIREAACAQASWLGIALDPAANAASGLRRISSDASRVAVWVIPTNEELMIAQHTQAMIAS